MFLFPTCAFVEGTSSSQQAIDLTIDWFGPRVARVTPLGSLQYMRLEMHAASPEVCGVLSSADAEHLRLSSVPTNAAEYCSLLFVAQLRGTEPLPRFILFPDLRQCFEARTVRLTSALTANYPRSFTSCPRSTFEVSLILHIIRDYFEGLALDEVVRRLEEPDPHGLSAARLLLFLGKQNPLDRLIGLLAQRNLSLKKARRIATAVATMLSLQQELKAVASPSPPIVGE